MSDADLRAKIISDLGLSVDTGANRTTPELLVQHQRHVLNKQDLGIDDINGNDLVHYLAGAQTITGLKTFTAPTEVGNGFQVGDGVNSPVQLSHYNLSNPVRRILHVRDEIYSRLRFGNGGPPHLRNPFNNTVTIDGAQLTSTSGLADKVGMQNNVTFKGGFSNEVTWGAPDPSFIWGANDFVQTGTSTGDLTGISVFYSRLTEAHLYTPGATLTDMQGLAVDMAIEASAIGATVNNLYGVRVSNVKDNTVAKTAIQTGAYAFYAADVTASSDPLKNFGFYAAGNSRNHFSGPVDVSFGATATELNIYESMFRGYKATIGGNVVATRGSNGLTSDAILTVKSRSDSDVVAWIHGRGSQTGDILRLGRDSTIGTRFDMRGRIIHINSVAPADADLAAGELAMYVDPTSGAMKLLIKGKDTGGTVRTGSVALV